MKINGNDQKVQDVFNGHRVKLPVKDLVKG